MVGRKKERRWIEEAISDSQSSFIAIYGRRRVGKTYLVKETVGVSGFAFAFTGSKQKKMKDELQKFRYALEEYGHKCRRNPRNWAEAFEWLKFLLDNSPKPRKIVFLDEISWMATRGSDFLPSFEHFYNSYVAYRNDIVLIVCASATSWLVDNIINNKCGLHERLDREIRLSPFSLGECQQLMESRGESGLTRFHILQLYMVFGGVAAYWSKIDPYKSVEENVDEFLFRRHGQMENELDYLYSALFDSPDCYIDIVRLLGKYPQGLSRKEIKDKLKLTSSGDLSKKLGNLEKCDFLSLTHPLDEGKNGGTYRLEDFFTSFYFAFLDGKNDDEHFFSNNLGTPSINTWAGLAFERVASRHLPQIRKALGMDGVSSSFSFLSTRQDENKGLLGCQVDLLAKRKDFIIDLFEVKLSSSPYNLGKEDEEAFRRKDHDVRVLTKGRYAIHNVLISPYGITKGKYSSCIHHVIDMDDLFSDD